MTAVFRDRIGSLRVGLTYWMLPPRTGARLLCLSRNCGPEVRDNLEPYRFGKPPTRPIECDRCLVRRVRGMVWRPLLSHGDMTERQSIGPACGLIALGHAGAEPDVPRRTPRTPRSSARATREDYQFGTSVYMG